MMRSREPASAIVLAFLFAGCLAPGGADLESGSEPEGGVPTISRAWLEPVAVAEGGFNEPLIATHTDGTIYYSPTRRLFRSDDGGETWTRIDPPPPSAMPGTDLGADTSVSVSPDGTVWWTRFWPYLGPTLGC